MASKIAIQGLRELQKAMRSVDSKAPAQIRLAQNDAASYLIDRVQPQIPRRTGAAASSLRARSSQRLTRIAVGGKKAPYYPWLDFGGRTGPGGSAVRPFIKDGRYLYPTYHANKDQFQHILQEAILRVAAGVGLEAR